MENIFEVPSCKCCGNDATHNTTGRGDELEATCGKCCGGCDEVGCDGI